jgi:very-short-patch-repair endonuclease
MSGTVSMNFGPLNRDGGERRLNVAVTRARHELRVFSSLRGDQMDLSRTKAAGVRDLKHFLEFAERGPRALAEAHQGSQGDFDSPFETAVAQALGRKGWQVHTQIGASSFRVDLGVVHPDFAGRYLAGVECDGATYHRSATARDRDKLREQVLRGLGWEIVRIWSTDWWVNPGGTLERVHDKLTALLEGDRAQRAVATASALGPDAGTGENHEDLTAAAETGAVTARAAADSRGDATDDAGPAVTVAPATYAGAAAASPGSAAASMEQPTRPLFRISQPAEAVPAEAISAERFFEPGYEPIIEAMVEWVVQREGPVLDSVLARRIARAHGFQRTGSRIQERVERIARRRFKATEEPGGTFYWPRGMEPSSGVAFRWPADDSSERGAEELCEAELLSLARRTLQQGHSGQEALVVMARELGLQRLREASRDRLDAALRRAQDPPPL